MFTDEFKQLQEAAKRSGATTSKSIKGVADALLKLKEEGNKKVEGKNRFF